MYAATLACRLFADPVFDSLLRAANISYGRIANPVNIELVPAEVYYSETEFIANGRVKSYNFKFAENTNIYRVWSGISWLPQENRTLQWI